MIRNPDNARESDYDAPRSFQGISGPSGSSEGLDGACNAQETVLYDVFRTVAAEYAFHQKPGMLWNWGMIWAVVLSFGVDLLVIWALIRAVERYAR